MRHAWAGTQSFLRNTHQPFSSVNANGGTPPPAPGTTPPALRGVAHASASAARVWPTQILGTFYGQYSVPALNRANVSIGAAGPILSQWDIHTPKYMKILFENRWNSIESHEHLWNTMEHRGYPPAASQNTGQHTGVHTGSGGGPKHGLCKLCIYIYII